MVPGRVRRRATRLERRTGSARDGGKQREKIGEEKERTRIRERELVGYGKGVGRGERRKERANQDRRTEATHKKTRAAEDRGLHKDEGHLLV